MEVKIVFQQVSQGGRADRRRDYVILPVLSPLRLVIFREKSARGLGESHINEIRWKKCTGPKRECC